MEQLKLTRRRFIPDEIVDLDNDEILLRNDEIIITKWKTLKPRNDFVRGYSCVYLKKGFKISKFINISDACTAIYCDIIETDFLPDENRYVFTDLLIDLVVYPGGGYKLLDLDEVAVALEKHLITLDQAKRALLLANELLNAIYSGQFGLLTEHLEDLR